MRAQVMRARGLKTSTRWVLAGFSSAGLAWASAYMA